jgi:UDPglucose 6-dehydrogenase
MTDYLVDITRSTVPLGTAEKVRDAFAAVLDLCDVGFGYAETSNPEFLKEGSAIDDFMKPDRIVV